MQTGISPKKNEIPVVIVEDHNEVLYYLYRAIGSKKLPFEHGSIVHFDSHPDMVIPEKFDTDRIFDKEYVMNSVSIESWLLPAVYARHFTNISWIKPPWASQLSEGRHEFKIGRHKETKEMKVTSSEVYFVSELAWATVDDLEKVSDVNVEVCTLADLKLSDSNLQEACAHHQQCVAHETASFIPQAPEILLTAKFRSSLQQQPYVLDIDLDFYSTRNPFLDLFTKEQFQLLSELYHYEHARDPLNQKSLQEVTEKRKKQLSELRSSILRVKEGGDCSRVEDPRLASLLESLKHDGSDVDLELLHSAGCTCDDCDLPHHVSSREQILELVDITRNFLKTLPSPSFITISRSSRDDYCPPEDVEFIQDLVIKMLSECYGRLCIQWDYKSNDET